MLDTHKEDDIRNTEINDIRKIKRGRRREGYGIRTPNGDDIKDSESDDIRNTLKQKMLETLTFWRRNYFFNFSTSCI